jgi:hypothetical protein
MNKQEADPILEKLRLNVAKIKKTLEFTLDNTSDDICHYTKLSTLPLWLNAKNETSQRKFRLSNSAYLNDPSEGQILFEKLRRGGIFNEERNMETSLSEIYIGSFSLKKDKLPMWTQYGDDSKGCCAVFSKNFFLGRENPSDLKNDSKYEQALKLYKVHYCNAHDPDPDPDIDKYINDISILINISLERIEKDKDFKKKFYSCLNGISFFFKDNDYSHEEEVRLVLTTYDETNEIRIDRNASPVPKLFMEVANPVQLTEVILGKKVYNPSEITPFLRYAGVEKVTLSKIHYR